jgi:GTP-binding protein
MRKNFKAMTFDQPGVTRDRNYDICNIGDERDENEEEIILVDTGGFYPEKIEEDKRAQRAPAEPFFDMMADHAKLAIAESDLILFIVDIREGLLPFDKSIADYIRTTEKTMWLIINKFDSDKQWGDEVDFYELGLKEEQFFIVSAEHNRGLSDLRTSINKFAANYNSEDPNLGLIQNGVKPNFDVVGNVSIIGAPNAGKSTLLNRLVGSQRALVSSVAGTTVDPIEGYFDLFFGEKAKDIAALENKFRKSDDFLFEEMLEFEEEFEEGELFAYNSMPKDLQDSSGDLDNAEEMNASQIDETEGDLFTVDDISESIDTQMASEEVEDETSEKTVSDEIASEDSLFRSLRIVDTAGIRKRSKVEGFIEEQSVYRSLKAITESDIVVYMIDSTKGISHQDRRLCDIALEKGKSIIICLNKVDLLNSTMQDQKKKREWLLDLRSTIPWLSYCELITISAKKGSYLTQLKKSIVNTLMVRRKKIGTSKLNKTVASLIDRHPIVVSSSNGNRFNVKYASMLKSAPPTFLLFSNKSQGIPANYRKYLSKGLRAEFNLVNTPVHLIFRTTTDIEKRLRKTL